MQKKIRTHVYIYMYNVSESRLVLYFNVMCKKKKEQITKDKKRYVRKKKTIRHTPVLRRLSTQYCKKIIDTMCTSFTDKFLLPFIPPFFLIIIIPFDCCYTSDTEADTIHCNRINLQLVRPNRIVDRVIFVHCTFLNTRSMERRIPFLFV